MLPNWESVGRRFFRILRQWGDISIACATVTLGAAPMEACRRILR